MRFRLVIGAAVGALLIGPVGVFAQIPGVGGLPSKGSVSVPSGGLSKDTLLAQATEMVSDLTSMESSGKLGVEQTKQVATLLPKATSLKSELEKPKVEPEKLPQLASDVNDLQKQVRALKSSVK